MFYWQFCPFKVFESKLEERKEKYYNLFFDASDTDFFKYELDRIHAYFQEVYYEDVDTHEKERVFEYVFIIIEKNNVFRVRLDFLDNVLLKQLRFTTEKKIEFLETKLGIKRKTKIETERNESIEKPEISLDYSGNNNPEKIVFLHELGILDFLQEKMNNELHYFNANKLAEIVSTFTDIKQGTAQPMLNPIFSKGIKEKNNPLTEYNLKKVKNKLKDIGFNNTKTT